MFDDLWERDRLRKEEREMADQAAIVARQQEQTSVLDQQMAAIKASRCVGGASPPSARPPVSIHPLTQNIRLHGLHQSGGGGAA